MLPELRVKTRAHRGDLEITGLKRWNHHSATGHYHPAYPRVSRMEKREKDTFEVL